MRRYFTVVSVVLLLSCSLAHSQNKSIAGSSGLNAKMNWLSKDKMPGNIPAFEENMGQFPASVKGWKILYGCNNYDGVGIYLTDKGIIYNISKIDKDDIDVLDNGADPDGDEAKKTTIHYQHIYIEWENALTNAAIEGQEQTPYAFSEGLPGSTKETVTGIKGFRKVIYYDLYPGIDVEFSFHKGKGIKYTIKAKPGYDAGIFKMKYSGESSLSFDDAHNLHIGTINGDIIDYAPEVTVGGAKITSSFQKAGNEIIWFNIEHSTAGISNETIIDPWTVFPTSPANYASDVAMDAANNTYVLEYIYPGTVPMTMYVQKYNPTGGLIWTYTLNEFTTTPYNPIETDSSSCFTWRISDMVADEAGNTYIASPFGFYNATNPGWQYGMVSLNTLGIRNYMNYTYSADSISEVNNVAYSCADSILIEAACRVCCNWAQFDGVNMATGNPNPGEYANSTNGDIVAGTIAPNGNYYCLSASKSPGNALMCGKVTHTSASLLWQVPTSYPWVDGESKGSVGQEGSNGMAAGCAYLYTSDGATLDQRDLGTGSIIKTITIPGGSNTSGSANSGIAVDLECGNVYVGSNLAIYIYDQNLNLLGSFAGLPGLVSDVRCSNGLIAACGDSTSNVGFVVQFNTLPCASGLSITHTDAGCNSNIGSATANATFCVAPYTYLWSPGGQTTQTASGLSAGTYTVTVSPSGTCFSVSDTVTIHGAGVTISSTKDSICAGDTLTLSVDTATGITYLWSPGGSTKAIIQVNPLTITTYTVHMTGGACTGDSATFTVNIIPAVTGTVSTLNDTICPGGTATLTAKGTGGNITYKWSTGATTSGINISPASTTTYTATIYGTCGSANIPVNVIVVPLSIPVITGSASKCIGAKDTLHVRGGTTYKWSNGNTTTTYYTGAINADSTITVVAYNSLGCPDTTHFNIGIQTNSVTAGNASVCSGDCVTLKAIAGGSGSTYNWSNGATTDTTTVCDTATTTYTVTANNGCTAAKTVTVQVYAPSLYACCDTTISSGQSASLTVNGSHIVWMPPANLNCDSCSAVIATPTVTTTYSVTATDSHGCETTRLITVIVEQGCFNFKVPNVFTPDFSGTNGVNNVFYIKTENITSWSTIIYDRWGKEMFKTNNPDEYWTGVTESGGKAPDGVYYYIINGTCQNNSYKTDGFLQLIR